MKYKNVFIPLLILFCCYLFVACSKNANRPNDPNPPAALEDSAALLLGKWKLIKDSSTNIGNYYFVENGIVYYPNPGTYLGKPEDYFDFKADGKVDMHANNNLFNYTYELYPNSKLLVFEIMLSVDTASIVRLTPTDAVIDWIPPASPNGGKFFRRTYLKK